MRIEPPHPRICSAINQGIKVHDLIERVHPGIGSARADRRVMRSSKSENRSFELILNRETGWLSLPSQPVTTIVGDAQRNAWHAESAQPQGLMFAWT